MAKIYLVYLSLQNIKNADIREIVPFLELDYLFKLIVCETRGKHAFELCPTHTHTHQHKNIPSTSLCSTAPTLKR